jgi:hypothetical protein
MVLASFGSLDVCEKYHFDLQNGFKRVWYNENRIFSIPGPWARSLSDSIKNTGDIPRFAPQLDSLKNETKKRIVRAAIKKTLKEDDFDDYLQAELLIMEINDDTAKFNYKGRVQHANEILCRLSNGWAYCLIEMADVLRIIPDFKRKYFRRCFVPDDFVKLARAAKRGFAPIFTIMFAFLMPIYDSDGSVTLTTFFIIDDSFIASRPQIISMLYSLIFHMRLASRGIAPVSHTRPIYSNEEMTSAEEEADVLTYMREDDSYTERDEDVRSTIIANGQTMTRVEFQIWKIMALYNNLFQMYTAIHEDKLETFNCVRSEMKYCILFGSSVRCVKKKNPQADCREDERIYTHEQCCVPRHPTDNHFDLREAVANLRDDQRAAGGSFTLENVDPVEKLFGDYVEDKTAIKRIKLESST